MIAGLVLAVGLVILLPLLVLDGVFLIETLGGLLPIRRRVQAAGGAGPRTAILIPAHNEAATLGTHLARLLPALPQSARVLLVADNCTDDTASIARAAGVEVAERHDPRRRGKGYALDFGRTHLAGDAPDIVVILDADCMAEPGAVARLAASAQATGRPVQAAYLFRPAPTASPLVQMSNFAFAVKNRVRQRGARRIGAAAILTGSGIAFPWPLFTRLPLASGEVVEDLVLGLDSIRAGRPPRYEDGAVVWSDASSAEGTQVQRARWEGGFLATARRHAMPLLVEAARHFSWKRLWMALHLLTPPLTLLLALNVAAIAALFLLWIAGLPVMLPLWAGGAVLAVMAAVAGAWVAVGRDQLPLAGAVRVPAYVLWKIGLHLKLASGRQDIAWTRTERVDPPQDRAP